MTEIYMHEETRHLKPPKFFFRRRIRLLTGVVVLLSLFCSQQSMAQKKVKAEPPSWITMMDDPNINYFEAVKAFEAYWKNKEKPIEENELFESEEDKEKQEKLERKRKRLSKNDPAKLYAFEYKRFLWWKNQVEPFVQSDGRIKSMDDRINDWKIQKQQKKSQGQKPQKKSPDPDKKN